MPGRQLRPHQRLPVQAPVYALQCLTGQKLRSSLRRAPAPGHIGPEGVPRLQEETSHAGGEWRLSLNEPHLDQTALVHYGPRQTRFSRIQCLTCINNLLRQLSIVSAYVSQGPSGRLLYTWVEFLEASHQGVQGAAVYDGLKGGTQCRSSKNTHGVFKYSSCLFPPVRALGSAWPQREDKRLQPACRSDSVH